MRNKEGKILLRLSGDQLPTKAKVFETLQLKLNVPLIALKPVRLGYQAITEHQHEIDKLMTNKATEQLGKIGLETRLPPRVKADRSIICRKVDSSVGERTKEEIKEEIVRCNRGREIVEVIKFGSYTHVFKIEFRTIEQAETAQRQGILCFNVKIASHQIEKEKYTDILMCFSCYKLEDHTTSNCPTKDTVVCSECTGNHSYRECNSQTKKCLNCGGQHRTMAMSCPKKKEIIRNKRSEEENKEKEKQELTYAKVAEKAFEKANQQTKNIESTQTMLDNLGLRSIIMIMDAHIHNIIDPGSYNKRLNQTLENNNIQKVNLATPDSSKLLSHQIIGETIEAMARTEKLEKLERIGKQLGDEDSSDESEMEEAQTEEEYVYDSSITPANKYSMKIFALESKVIKTSLSHKNLKFHFELGNIKYQVTDPTISIQMIETLIKDKKISAPMDDITFLHESAFRKIRNGFSKSPTKPQQAKKHKK